MADLDPRQQAAVDAGPTEVFISAGAGSGKTRVLSTRFVSAVLGREPYERTEPDRLVAVTFTEKAAGELSERIRGALIAAGEPGAARAISSAWISTIHGMCTRLLRRHALEAGIDPHFVVLDDIGASALEAEALEQALRDSLEDPVFVALLDTFGVDGVASATRQLCGNMHALGLGVADVTTLDSSDVLRDLGGASAGLEELAAEFTKLSHTKTAAANAEAARSLASALRHSSLADQCDLQALLAAAETCRPRRVAGAEEHNDVVDACKGRVERVRGAIAQLLVVESERALIGFAEVFESHYRSLKHQRGALDFEDLQLKTAELFETHPGVAGRYREHFSMIMLDESQDTNELQLRIIEGLSSENLCTVGDENQSIYAFRHADVSVFRARESRTECRRALDINYRTTPALLSGINELFSHPALLGKGFMQLQPPDGATGQHADRPVFEVRFIDPEATKTDDSHAADAAFIAARVAELMAGGAAPGQVAVLMRALSGGRARKVEAALLARGIPAYISSGGSFFEQPEVAEARALLAAIANVWDDMAMAVVLAGRLTRMSPDGLIALRAHADGIAAATGRSRYDVHLWDAMTDARVDLTANDRTALARTVAVIERARESRGTRPLGDTVLEPLLELDADLMLFSSARGGARAWANLLKLARMAQEYEAGTPGGLAGFLEYLALREMHATSEQEATLDGESDAVRVMSVHAAKGLEFPHVIVSGLTGSADRGPVAFARIDGIPTFGMKYPCPAGLVPTLGFERASAVTKAAEDAEAVRLLYVACTRAEQSLTIIGRSDPAKEAGDGLTDLVRTALGLGAPEALVSRDVMLGGAVVGVRLLDTLPDVSETGTSDGRGGAPVGQRRPPLTPRPPAPKPRVPRRISYSGLATYERCAYRYYLTSIVRLPAPPAARSGEALAFGSALHAVLERLESPADDPTPLIEAASAAAGLDAAGRRRLADAVAAYLAMNVSAEVSGYATASREVPIAVPIGDTVLVGAIDLLARTGDEALVVDYKTGSGVLDAGEALERYRLQGECYALAAFADGARSVKVVFAEVERGRESVYRYSADDIPALEERVSAIVARLADDAFAPRASYDPQLCETCPGFGGLCPVRRPGRGAV